MSRPFPGKSGVPEKMRLYTPNLEFSNQSHTTSLEFFGEPTLTQTLGSTFANDVRLRNFTLDRAPDYLATIEDRPPALLLTNEHTH